MIVLAWLTSLDMNSMAGWRPTSIRTESNSPDTYPLGSGRYDGGNYSLGEHTCLNVENRNRPAR